MPSTTLSALYFPTTWMAAATAARLLLPFDTLHVYRPTEGPPSMPQPFGETGLVTAHAPAPLGAELDRFRRLLKDMQSHATEYYQAYLSSLAAGAEEDPEAGWRQMARQLKQTAPAREAGEDSLWRARLYLALAEHHAAMEEELAAGIQAVSRRETELLRQLQGDEEELADLQLLTPSTPAGVTIRAEQLLAAWGLLYLADRRADRPWLLATAHEESAGLLFEAHARATGGSPDQLLSLPLPALGPHPEEEFAERRREWRDAQRPLLARLEEVLTAAAGGADAGAAAELAAAWHQAVGPTKKPAAEDRASGPAPAGMLTFYRLAGMPLPRLLGFFCRREAPADPSPAPHAVVAVLRG